MSISAYKGVCPTCRHDHSAPITALASGSGDHAELARLGDRNVELSVLAYKWMEAHDALKSGQPYDYPSPADVPAIIAENAAMRKTNIEAERKLAEAVGLLRDCRPWIRKITDLYGRVSTWLSK